jgi:Uma2 family endonuclease
MDVQQKLMTAEEFEVSPLNDRWVELVQGEILRMSPTGPLHGEIALTIGAAIRNWVGQHKKGKAYAAETGFILSRDPDTVRAPDAAFVASTELAEQQKRKKGFFEGAPDLVVEVMSPGDTDEEVRMKVLDYLNAGTRLIWIVSPRTQTVTVYQSLSEIKVLTREETLDGGDVLPGLTIAVSEIFGD